MTAEVVRIDVALIPSEPQFSKIIEASQSITSQFENFNIIDAKRFPPHISLLICKFPNEKIGLLKELFLHIPKDVVRKPPLVTSEIVAGTTGYISLEVEIKPELYSLHKWVIEAIAQLREGFVDEEPRWLYDYSQDDRDNFRKYGNMYVLERFSAHFSIAKVNIQDQSAAFGIAKKMLGQLPAVLAKDLQICDIGMRNEKWDVLYSF